MGKRIVIVGGVAAGASAAAKARRMTEDLEIVLIEAGPYISFANCGLPYYVGGEIGDREDLFVVKPALFARRFNVDLRLSTCATSIDRGARAVTIRGPDGRCEQLTYDRLILATGGVGIVPPIRGLDRPDIFTLRTVPDVDAIASRLSAAAHADVESAGAPGLRNAVVIGGGYIGLEAAEQLLRRGLRVTVIEMADQLMLALDAEMAEPLRCALVEAGCEVILSDAVSEVVDEAGRSVVVTASGRRVPFDLGILAVGVRPSVELARSAAIELGRTGAIRVDAFQRTSDAAVYAAGDNSETCHLVLGRPVNIPLAGPANKAGRVAGANAALDLAGAADDDPLRLRMPPVLGTAVVRVCGAVGGVTGLTEAQARREGIGAEVMYLPGASHAAYYPGADKMVLKLLYDGETGRVIGAQAVGGEGVDKRIDVLAAAITAGMTVEDLEGLDLAYAPPFGSAKDVAVMGGFAAANARRGLMPTVTPQRLLDELDGEDPPLVIDVRSPREFADGHLDEAVSIPVDELRDRLDDVPSDRPVAVHCGVGYRSYVAQRILMNHGRDNVRNILGGYPLLARLRGMRRRG